MGNVEDVLNKYKSILKNMGVNGKEMAELMRMNYISYRRATMSKAEKVPNWVITFLIAHDFHTLNDSEYK